MTGLPQDELAHRVTCESDPYNAIDGAHVFAVLTEWDQFRSLDYDRVYQRMTKPAFAFDGRNILPHATLRSIGFEVYGVGKPPA